jgi:ABC-type Fe3+/spermidine/putrescine transport system ATPase subunit
MRRVAASDRRRLVDDALRMVRLDGYGARQPNQLSGGQQQRVALARAIVYKPPVLLMDEPLGALDRKLREELQLELRSLQQQLGTTVVYVTHDQGEALTMSDRIAVIHEGRLRQLGTPRELYERPASAFVAGFIGETNLVAAQVTSTGGPLVVRLGSGDLVEVGNAGSQDLHPGAELRLGIRPERVRLHVGHDDGIAGRVTQVVYVGDVVRYQLEVDGLGSQLQVKIPAAADPAIATGEAASVSFPPDAVRIFAPPADDRVASSEADAA